MPEIPFPILYMLARLVKSVGTSDIKSITGACEEKSISTQFQEPPHHICIQEGRISGGKVPSLESQVGGRRHHI